MYGHSIFIILHRWAKKMRLEDEFPINNGTVRIKEPGTLKLSIIYYALNIANNF